MARLGSDGRYRAVAPRLVGGAGEFLAEMAQAAGEGGSAFVGFDFPLGLPAAYADRVGVHSFAALLPGLGEGEWVYFFFATSER